MCERLDDALTYCTCCCNLLVAVGVESAEMRSRFLGRFELAAIRLVYEPAVIVVVVLLLVEL